MSDGKQTDRMNDEIAHPKETPLFNYQLYNLTMTTQPLKRYISKILRVYQFFCENHKKTMYFISTCEIIVNS